MLFTTIGVEIPCTTTAAIASGINNVPIRNRNGIGLNQKYPGAANGTYA